MAQQIESRSPGMLAQLGQHWGWVLSFGIITLIAGVTVLAWPGPTLVVVAIIFGIQLIVTGIFRFVSAFTTHDLSGGTRALWAIIGALALIVGLYALRDVFITILALGLLLGIFWVIYGVAELFAAFSHRDVRHRGWTGAMGALSIVAGGLLLAYPHLSIVVLALLIGAWLLVFGIMEIAMAFRLRSAGYQAVAPLRKAA